MGARSRKSVARRVPLGREFFARDAATVAEAVIGTILVRQGAGRQRTSRRARIVEAEAYVGTHDLASHSSRGRTARTEVMFGPAGHAYVYLIYGVHEMFNIVTGAVGEGEAVLIRAAEPLDGWEADLSGPGRLARGMNITRRLNGIDLTSGAELFVLPAEIEAPAHPLRVGRAPRVGVDYAGDWRHELLRFYDQESLAVSKPRPTRRVD